MKATTTRKIIITLWCTFIGAVLLIMIFFIMLYNGMLNGVIGNMPPIEELKKSQLQLRISNILFRWH